MNKQLSAADQLALAIKLAAEHHLHQKDKGGNPYILHPMRIMMRLRTTDYELMAAAIMHDLVEDSPITLDELTGMGFSERVTRILGLMTHAKGEPYDAYIKRIGSDMDATRIKIEDLKDNSDITRMKGLTQKDFERAQKYQRSYMYLTGVLVAHDKAYGDA